MFYIYPELKLVTHQSGKSIKAVVCTDGLLSIFFESFIIRVSIFNHDNGIVVTYGDQRLSSLWLKDTIDSYNLVFNGHNQLEVVNIRLSTIQTFFEMQKVDISNLQKDFLRSLEKCTC